MSEQSNIPKHWLIKKLGEVGEIISGGTPSTKVAEYWNGKISWISPADLSGYVEKFILQGRKSITESGLKNSSARLIPKGSVLFSSRAPIGYVIIAGNELCTNQGFKSIVPNNSILSDYLFYYLKASKQKAEKVASGTTFKEISLKAFSELEIPIPPLPEQQTIVSKIEELLSDLENGKQQLQTARQQLKVYRQSLLKWAFEGKLTNKDVKDGELPTVWKWVTLGDVCQNVEYGSAVKSKKTGKVPVLRMGNIQNGKLDWEDLVFSDDQEEIEKYLLKKGDVLFNRTNSAEWVGKSAQYKGERPAIFAGYLIRINRIKSLIDETYLTYFLNTHFAKSYGNSVRSFGVNQSNINGTKLKTYPIPLCSLDEQQLIVSELESKLTVCDKIEETIRQSLQQAETLRQSILKKAFEGKLINCSI